VTITGAPDHEIETEVSVVGKRLKLRPSQERSSFW
jgi:hypothetical protein